MAFEWAWLLVWLIGVGRCVGQEPIHVDTPVAVAQCTQFELTFSGGTPPYHIQILPSHNMDEPALADLPITTQTSVLWNVTIPAGTSCVVTVQDESGLEDTSDPFIVGPGLSAACISSPASPSNSNSDLLSSEYGTRTDSKELPPKPTGGDSQATSKPAYGAIIGGMLGGLLVVAACGLCLLQGRNLIQRIRTVNLNGDQDPINASSSEFGARVGSTRSVREAHLGYLHLNSDYDVQEWSPASLISHNTTEALIRSSDRDTAPPPMLTIEQEVLIESLVHSNAPRESVASVIQVITGGAFPRRSDERPPEYESVDGHWELFTASRH